MPASLSVAIFFLIGLTFGLARSQAIRIAGLLVGSGPLILAAMKIFRDISRDPSSHNLFPFELASAFALSLAPAFGGITSGYLAQKLFRVRPVMMLVPGSAAAALIVLSPVITRSIEQHDQRRAIQILRRLWQAEQTYAAASPNHRFTCEGPKLPGFEHQQWFAWTQLGLTTKDHMNDAGFFFQLRCGALSRGDDLLITARSSGGQENCIDRAGAMASGTSTTPCRPDAGRR